MYAIDPLTTTLPDILYISPKTALIIELLPLPTLYQVIQMSFMRELRSNDTQQAFVFN